MSNNQNHTNDQYHVKLEDLDVSGNKGDGAIVELGKGERSHISRSVFSNNGGTGLVIKGNYNPTLDLFLESIKDKLPQEISIADITPLVQELINIKDPKLAEEKAKTSPLSAKVKEYQVWIGFVTTIVMKVWAEISKM